MNSIELLVEIIRDHNPEDIWSGSPLVGYRLLGNTNRGEIGEEFVRTYLRHAGLRVTHGSRTEEIDMEVEGAQVEIKTASLGANGTFQFNHVRLDRAYDYLICLGICPHEIVFNLWGKHEVSEGLAGHLVEMAQDQGVTYKLTKKLTDMRPVEALVESVRERLTP